MYNNLDYMVMKMKKINDDIARTVVVSVKPTLLSQDRLVRFVGRLPTNPALRRTLTKS